MPICGAKRQRLRHRASRARAASGSCWWPPGSCASQEPNQQEWVAQVVAQQHARQGRLHVPASRRGRHCTLISSATTLSGTLPAGVVICVLADRGAVDALDIEPVAVAVGEAPGDVPVGAGHEQRRSGQRHAIQIQSGSRTPVTFRRAWYQMVGTRCPRCMSLATSAAPVVVSAPADRPAVAAHARRALTRCGGRGRRGARRARPGPRIRHGSVGRRRLRGVDTPRASQLVPRG